MGKGAARLPSFFCRAVPFCCGRGKTRAIAQVAIERVYRPACGEVGSRWCLPSPGVKKQSFRYVMWDKQIAPSDGLRRWYHADPERRRPEFRHRYVREQHRSGICPSGRRQRACHASSCCVRRDAESGTGLSRIPQRPRCGRYRRLMREMQASPRPGSGTKTTISARKCSGCSVTVSASQMKR